MTTANNTHTVTGVYNMIDARGFDNDPDYDCIIRINREYLVYIPKGLMDLVAPNTCGDLWCAPVTATISRQPETGELSLVDIAEGDDPHVVHETLDVAIPDVKWAERSDMGNILFSILRLKQQFDTGDQAPPAIPEGSDAELLNQAAAIVAKLINARAPADSQQQLLPFPKQ